MWISYELQDRRNQGKISLDPKKWREMERGKREGKMWKERLNGKLWSDRRNFWPIWFSVLPWASIVLWSIKHCSFNCSLPKTSELSLCLLSVKLCVTSSFYSYLFYCEEDKQLCYHPSRQCHLQKCSAPMSRKLVLF